jgi:hypothetical protein
MVHKRQGQSLVWFQREGGACGQPLSTGKRRLADVERKF